MKNNLKEIIMFAGGTIISVVGAIVGWKGFKGLAFEEHEVGDLIVKAANEATEEVDF